MIKIESKVLINFLKKVRMDGSQSIQECLLRFEIDGLKIDANSISKQSRVMGYLRSSAFKEYESIGNIGLNDFGKVIKVLERFKDIIIIEKKGNLLTISQGKKKVHIELVSEQFIEDASVSPDLIFSNNFNIESKILKDIFKDISMNRDATIVIKSDKGKVLFTNTGKYKFFNEFDAPFCKENVCVKFGVHLIDATIGLDGCLNFKLKTDYPLLITEELDISIINIMVSPIVEE